MTIKYKDKFSQSNSAGFDGLFDWDFLLPAFAGTKIQFMDFDGVVERNGKFLLIETKDEGVPIPTGQRITLQAVLNTGLWTVTHLEGKSHLDIRAVTFYTKGMTIPAVGAHERRICPATPAYVLAKIRRWFKWANGGVLPESENSEWWESYDQAEIGRHEKGSLT